MSINVVTLSGRVSRSPKRVRAPEGGGHAYVFPLAVREEGEIVFPIVVAGELPSFVAHRDDCKLHEQPLVTVVGRVRTRNLTQPLPDDVASQAKRAGAAREVVAAVREHLADLGLESRRVVTEIVAESIFEGGCW
jgi:phage terminase large subunit-like protein